MPLTPEHKQIVADAEAGRPDAQFLLSQVCLQNGDTEGMLHWLHQACANGVPDAIAALGRCYEKGQGLQRDMVAAMEHYDRAIQAGSSFAAYEKAQLLYKSRQGAESSDLVYELLVNAAEANVIPALRSMGYLAMQHESQKDIALACLRRAAVRGDPVSSFILGSCLLEGWRGEEDSDEAVQWLQQAASVDYPFAAALLSSLQGTQPVPKAQLPEEKIQFGAAFALYPQSQGVDQQVICTDPPITLFKNVLSVVDCAYLIFLSRPYLQRAHVIDPEGDESGMVSDVRTSMSTYLPFEMVDIISRFVELRIIHTTGEDLLSSEPMSILQYAPGEYYRPHVDFFDPKLTVAEEFFQDGGQRTASAVTYLVAPAAGGGTSFPKLDLTVPASMGSILWFRNCFDDGEIDERSLHAGDTVDDGEKWVVTKWFRENPTRYLQL
ncbi:MAG: 2OG-Fe(II) oxygenase [Woeseiaceae bacterium]